MSARTPGPWHVAADEHDNLLFPLFITPYTTDDTRFAVATVGMQNYHACGLEDAKREARANAAFIVEACNAHDGLVARVAELEEQRDAMAEALRNALHQLSTDSDLDTVTRPDKYAHLVEQIRSALAAVGGVQRKRQPVIRTSIERAARCKKL